MHFYALSSLLLVSVTLSLALPAAEEVDLAPYVEHLREKRSTSTERATDIAQAICTAINPSGWMYAVRRDCTAFGADCNSVCTSTSLRNRDGQTQNKAWSCVNSLHVYDALSSGTSSYTLGPKVYRYNSCGGGCGPNYCCCRAAP